METNFLNLIKSGGLIKMPRLSATRVREAIESGDMKPSDVLFEYISNIDKHETQVGAWSFVTKENALQKATELDKKKPEGVLFGVPFGIKDNIDTFDMPTEYGTNIYEGYKPVRDASCVAGFRGSGAIPLGKTVCAEFAHRDPGKTANPWNVEHTPGGSSSGSAAAVASGMVPISIGTQTTGSVIRPAAYCGVVGYKPTYGEFNISGVLANTPSFDTLGFFSTCVEDLILIRKALLDPSVRLLKEFSMKEAKVAIAKKPYWEEACSSSQKMVEDGAKMLGKAGAKIVEFDDCGAFENLSEANIRVSGYEFARTLAHERLMSLEKLSKVLREGRMADGLRIEFNDYLEAKKNIEEARVRLDRAMDAVDFVICPAAQSAAPKGLSATGSADFNMAWTSLHTPVVTLPVACEQNSGLPLGLQVIGSRHADDKLLSYANSVFNVLTE
ncbi:MAG: hypothetical protein CMM58_03315 [Rhodospirillaceae bacterium]|nr:hypothetical protein [Rhodospirillaceae bacterium]|tara:strand:+ start:942 stop:2270 length:1329 start_codon:yes stop_codon:yes gene_type:complete